MITLFNNSGTPRLGWFLRKSYHTCCTRAIVHPSPDAQGLSYNIYCCICHSKYVQHGLRASPTTPPHATRGRRLVIPSTHLARSHTGAEPSASLSSMHREQLY